MSLRRQFKFGWRWSNQVQQHSLHLKIDRDLDDGLICRKPFCCP